MKIRLKFQKTGSLAFIGHLDVMRYFQKLNRRASIDVCYTAGFSPHQKMAFGAPLSLGVESVAEYADIEVRSVPHKEELLAAYEHVNVPDLAIRDACILPDGAKNAMSVMAASDYLVTFRENMIADETLYLDAFLDYFSRDSLIVTTEGKKEKKTFDLISAIRKIERRNNGVFLCLDTGSKRNVKPELLFETFSEAAGRSFDPYALKLKRLELYGETEEHEQKPLIDYGVREF